MRSKFVAWYARVVFLLTRQQSKFILWPASIAFVLAYPALYSIAQSASSGSTASLVDIHNAGNDTDFDTRQLWLQPGFEETHNALARDFMLEALELQQQLTAGMEEGQLFTPFEYWDNNSTLLRQDNNILRTIQQHKSSQHEHDALLAGVVRVDGVVISASALKVSLVFRSESNAGDIWDANLARIHTKLQILVPSEASQSLTLQFVPWASLSSLAINFAYLCMAVYVVMSIANVQSVKSRVGLLVAFVVEIALALLASATITSFFFTTLDLLEVPIQVLAFVVIVVGLENMFRLINAIAATPEDLPMNRRFVDAFVTRGFPSTITVAVNSLNLLVLTPLLLGGGKSTVQFCTFATLALVFDHLLHLTYFTSVLYIDMRRMELEDLLHDQTARGFSQPSKLNRLQRYAERYVGKARLPLTTTATGSVVSVLFLLFANAKWMGREYLQNSKLAAITPPEFHTLFGSDETLTFQCSTGYVPFFLSKKTRVFELLSRFGLKSMAIRVREPIVATHGAGTVRFNVPSVYKYDIYYVLEFIACLTFILSTACIVLKFSLDKQDIGQLQENQEEEGVLNANGRASFHSKELTRGHFLDVVKISTSSCPFVVTVGMDHKVLVWSPMNSPLPVPTQLPVSVKLLPIVDVVLSNSGSFIAIFSRTGVVKCWSRLSMSWIWSIQIDALKTDRPLESFFRKRTVSSYASRRSRAPNRANEGRGIAAMQHFRSMSIDSAYDRSNNLKALSENLDKDFITVLPDGTAYVVSCEDGSVAKVAASTMPLVCVKKLISPRVNDRLVCLTEDASLVIGTAINNKWKFRKVQIQRERYNSTPVPPRASPLSYRANIVAAPAVAETKECLGAEYGTAEFSTVPFVGMIVCAHGTKADLIDVQTGILLKTFDIGEFQRGSFNVFHPDPYHCRFCGCASVPSFSFAYLEKNTHNLALHTFSIDNRAKNNICLRVERDPRETRCLGFDSVSEHRYWMSNVEGWCTTDLNMLIGVRKKNSEETVAQPKTLRNRKQRQSTKIPSLSEIWEGWTLSSSGKARIFEIPNGLDQGLLVKSLGPVAKFGHKSIVVAFGNVMKILYLGNDNLIEEGDLDTEGISGNENSAALSFINRRRKMTLKRYNLTHSTNFNDSGNAE